MQSTNYIETEQRFGAHNYKPLDVVLARGEGVWVWDVEGTRYMDMLSAYSAMSHGHCHPKVIAALKAQADVAMDGTPAPIRIATPQAVRIIPLKLFRVWYDWVATGAVAFLLSPRSSGINAQRIVVDAGMSINYFDRDLVHRAMRPD